MQRLLTDKRQAKGILLSLVDHLDDLFPEGQQSQYSLEIEDAEEKRTLLQNRYLYGWVYKQLAMALCDAGVKHPSGDTYSPGLVRLEMMVKFRVDGEHVEDGVAYPLYKSTKDMGKREFSGFIENMNRYYIEKHQVGIPDHRGDTYYANMAREIF